MFLYFKKRKFRKFIKNCSILEDEKVRTEPWFGDLHYIREGLHDWEQTILKEELQRVGEEKKKETEESRKKFFDKWKSK